MFFWFRGFLRSSLVVTIAAYAAGIVLAGTVAALGSYRVFTAVFAELALAGNPAQVGSHTNQNPEHAKVVASARPLLQQGEGRQAFMTPLQARVTVLPKSAAPAARLVTPILFGTSSRYWGRPPPPPAPNRNRDEDDEEERPAVSRSTYRTMCVRLCDGFYFPISFSATRDRFDRDAKTCERSCGGQARLFVYRNPGADVDDMEDLRGRPYRQLSTAFLYRTQYVAACRCQPQPWDTESMERHRMYALAAAKSKGNKQAARELNELMAKMKQSAKQPAPTKAVRVAAAPGEKRSKAGNDPTPAPYPSFVADNQSKMGLGARVPRERRDRRSPVNATKDRDLEWRRRLFSPTY